MALTQVQPAMLGTPQPNNFKNRIINGAMLINQRGSLNVAVTPANAEYTLDRWVYTASQTGKATITQVGPITAIPFADAMLLTSTSAYSVLTADQFTVQQLIEGFNTYDLNWGTANAKTVTLSAWVYSSLSGTFGGSLRNNAGDRSYPFSYSIPVANTWTQISVTIAGDTTGTWVGATNGIGLRVGFSLGAGATYSGTAGSWSANNYLSATGATSVVGTNGATFYITGVQLEVGSSATGFDYRPYGTELALCQRYCYALSFSAANSPVCFGTNFSTANFYGGLVFPVTMRVAPTTTFVTPANYNVLFSGTSAAGTLNQGITTAYQTELYTTGTGLTAGAGAWVRTAAATASQVICSAEL